MKYVVIYIKVKCVVKKNKDITKYKNKIDASAYLWSRRWFTVRRRPNNIQLIVILSPSWRRRAIYCWPSSIRYWKRGSESESGYTSTSLLQNFTDCNSQMTKCHTKCKTKITRNRVKLPFLVVFREGSYLEVIQNNTPQACFGNELCKRLVLNQIPVPASTGYSVPANSG
jgi:hypothetical protein